MPLVRIDLMEGKPVEYCRGIGDVVYQAMIEVLKVPKDDRFQVIAEHPQRSLIADENYLGIQTHAGLRVHPDHPQRGSLGRAEEILL